jgi:hypothetical protein
MGVIVIAIDTFTVLVTNLPQLKALAVEFETLGLLANAPLLVLHFGHDA